MEAAEVEFLAAEFLAPVLEGGRVRVRIAGLVCTLRVVDPPKPGWSVLKPLSLDRARVIGWPSLRQVRDYLALFPALRLLLVGRSGDDWLAAPARRGDGRFQIAGSVPVHLVTAAEPFQQVVARFDGQQFWLQEVDRRRSPAVSAYLREALAAETAPEALHKATLTAEERDAYGLAYQAVEAARRDCVETRLKEALGHGGAELASYVEREDAYTVTYTVDGRAHRSTVHKGDLTVLSAGVCLSGEDRRFDLQSLVGVLREGTREGQLVRIGDDGMLDEETYERIYPPDERP